MNKIVQAYECVSDMLSYELWLKVRDEILLKGVNWSLRNGIKRAIKSDPSFEEGYASYVDIKPMYTRMRGNQNQVLLLPLRPVKSTVRP